MTKDFKESFVFISKKKRNLGYNYFLEYIKTRIKANKNFLCAICGATGSGKSYASLRLAELLDPNFGSERICFEIKDFLELLDTGKLKAGSVIIFEETQVSSNARNFQSKSNKILNIIYSTFRCLNYIVIFNTPDLSFIDKQQRKLLHCYIETQGIDFKKELLYLKPLLIQNNAKMGDIYYKYLRMWKNNTKTDIIKVKRLGLKKPSKKILDEYEEAKQKFVRKQIKLQKEELAKMEEKTLTDEEKQVQRTGKIKTISEEVIANVDEYIGKRGAVKLSNIQNNFALGSGDAMRIKGIVQEYLKNR